MGTPTVFDAGSIVIPMDRDLQDDGILDAYGLTYELLRNGVPVHWVIDEGKVRDGDDLIAVDCHLSTESSSAATPRDFRGGPWVIDSVDASRALPIIDAWQADGWDAVAYVADSPFTGDLSHSLFAAPSIVIFEDGNEDIAWDYLNAAGIPDLDGNAWDRDSPYNIAESDLVGPDPAGGDGALFDEEGFARFCHLNAMGSRTGSRSGPTATPTPAPPPIRSTRTRTTTASTMASRTPITTAVSTAISPGPRTTRPTRTTPTPTTTARTTSTKAVRAGPTRTATARSTPSTTSSRRSTPATPTPTRMSSTPTSPTPTSSTPTTRTWPTPTSSTSMGATGATRAARADARRAARDRAWGWR